MITKARLRRAAPLARGRVTNGIAPVSTRNCSCKKTTGCHGEGGERRVQVVRPRLELELLVLEATEKRPQLAGIGVVIADL